MAPSYVSRGSDIDEELADRLIQRVQEDPAKPWTIVSDVADSTDESPETVRESLRKLTLKGKLTPTADGDLRATETLADV
jgi:DeoR/GlpR family transcriptional regulator of sugar metabolism